MGSGSGNDNRSLVSGKGGGIFIQDASIVAECGSSGRPAVSQIGIGESTHTSTGGSRIVIALIRFAAIRRDGAKLSVGVAVAIVVTGLVRVASIESSAIVVGAEQMSNFVTKGVIGSHTTLSDHSKGPVDTGGDAGPSTGTRVFHNHDDNIGAIGIARGVDVIHDTISVSSQCVQAVNELICFGFDIIGAVGMDESDFGIDFGQFKGGVGHSDGRVDAIHHGVVGLLRDLATR